MLRSHWRCDFPHTTHYWRTLERLFSINFRLVAPTEKISQVSVSQFYLDEIPKNSVAMLVRVLQSGLHNLNDRLGLVNLMILQFFF